MGFAFPLPPALIHNSFLSTWAGFLPTATSCTAFPPGRHSHCRQARQLERADDGPLVEQVAQEGGDAGVLVEGAHRVRGLEGEDAELREERAQHARHDLVLPA